MFCSNFRICKTAGKIRRQIMRYMMTIASGLLLLMSVAAGLPPLGNVATVTVNENMAGQIITNADFAQMSDIDAVLTGNSLGADQVANLNAVGNTLAGSKPDGKTFFCQLLDMDMCEKGNLNLHLGDLQSASLNATGNILTDSGARQEICQNDANIGNTNDVFQFANTTMTSDILTNAGALQKIKEDALSVGNSNTITQNEALTSTANTLTGGNILQQADACTKS